MRNSSDASERAHITEWNGTFAFVNIGLSGQAVGGNKWSKKHRPRLLRLFVELLTSEEAPMGIFLNEVGNLDHLLDEAKFKMFREVIEEAFQQADAVTCGPPQIFWNVGRETVAAFRAEVQVQNLDSLTKMKGVDPWRVVERFAITGATEHGTHNLLIYNNHQPASDKREFRDGQRIRFCRQVLLDAIRYHTPVSNNVGFAFGGDGNCNLQHCCEVVKHKTSEHHYFQTTDLIFAILIITDLVQLFLFLNIV